MGNQFFDNLVGIAKGIAGQFGPDCEVCIHDLAAEDLAHTIVFIANGHVTGRKIGDGASKAVLETVEAMKNGALPADRIGYQMKTADGHLLKSTTLFLKNEFGKYQYMLGINLDITAFANMNAVISRLTGTNGENMPLTELTIPMNVNDLLDSLIDQSEKMIGKSPALMTKEEKVRAIQYLKNAGAFLITKSGDKVSKHYGISKFTLYSYIDQKKTDL